MEPISQIVEIAFCTVLIAEMGEFDRNVDVLGIRDPTNSRVACRIVGTRQDDRDNTELYVTTIWVFWSEPPSTRVRIEFTAALEG